MRGPVINPTRSLRIVKDPFGTEPEVAGWYIREHDPVSGVTILPTPARATRAEALADLRALFAGD